jgi:hypothetical protein
MKYEEFLNCFENLSVCNLIPEKEYPLPKQVCFCFLLAY